VDEIRGALRVLGGGEDSAALSFFRTSSQLTMMMVTRVPMTPPWR
jgi:hypothetical protein